MGKASCSLLSRARSQAVGQGWVAVGTVPAVPVHQRARPELPRVGTTGTVPTLSLTPVPHQAANPPQLQESSSETHHRGRCLEGWPKGLAKGLPIPAISLRDAHGIAMETEPRREPG